MFLKGRGGGGGRPRQGPARVVNDQAQLSFEKFMEYAMAKKEECLLVDTVKTLE